MPSRKAGRHLRGTTRQLHATLRKPRIAERIKPYKAGRLVNEMNHLAENIGALPRVERFLDPGDDFLLALSEADKADYLVTGDKSGLLALVRHRATRLLPRAISGRRCSHDSEGQPMMNEVT